MICWPVQGGYRQRDHAPQDSIALGEYWRVNWLGHRYDLLKVPSIHEGDDIVPLGRNGYGDPIFAIADGRVIYAQTVYLKNGQKSSWGKLVVIQHLLDSVHVYSRYAHLKDMYVGKEYRVRAGQQIGTMGNADGQLPVHLHFSISTTERDLFAPTDWPSNYPDAVDIIRSNYVDPLEWLKVHMAENPPDPTVYARQWFAARPANTSLFVASIPPNREPVGTIDAIEVSASTMIELINPQPPKPPAPDPHPNPPADAKPYKVLQGVRVRIAEGTDQPQLQVNGQAAWLAKDGEITGKPTKSVGGFDWLEVFAPYHGFAAIGKTDKSEIYLIPKA